MFNKLNFQNKVFIYYSILISFVILCMFFVFYLYLNTIITQNTSYGIKQFSQKVSTQFDSMLNDMDKISTQVFANREIQTIMSKAKEYNDANTNYFDIYPKEKNIVLDDLVAINSPKVITRRICLYSNENNFISAGYVNHDPQTVQKNLTKIPWINDVYVANGKDISIPPHYDPWLNTENTEMVLSLTRTLINTYVGNTTIGVVEIQQPYSMIENICTGSGLPNLETIILNDKGDLIFPIDYNNKELVTYYNQLSMTIEAPDGQFIYNEIKQQKEFFYSIQSPDNNWTIIHTQPRKDFYKSSSIIKVIGVFFLIIILLITLIVVYVITKKLMQPIKNLTHSINQITLENLSINLSNDITNNEIIQLNKAFDAMFSQLEESIEQVIQAKSSELNATLLALQAQINPHFIYNTLMGISAIGQELGSNKITMICSSLSDLLRYSASFNNSNITIKNELNHAENYIQICKFRYENDFNFIINVDDCLHNINVPKLILQPLIENSFKHGFSTIKPPWSISIIGYIQNNHWIIEVNDDGVGFKKEDVLKLMRQIESYDNIKTLSLNHNMHSKKLGLLNIFFRLKLLYGEDAIFKVCPNNPSGAKIIIGGSIHY